MAGLLGQDVSGGHTAITGVPNLLGYEIDTRETIERSKKEIREKILWFLKCSAGGAAPEGLTAQRPR